MAARVQPGRVRAAHQSLHHFVAKADWSDDTVLAAVRARVLPLIAKRGPIRVLIIDDAGMPKKGRHSVGVARQYCGQLGKQDNCQVAVSLSAANDHASLPIAYRPYLPREWADAAERRAAAGVPDEIVSRPSRKSRWISCVPPSLRACRQRPCWPMPDTATTLISVTV
jgi:SRSO17 transposase